jgi:hypothetical protein
MQCSSQNGFTKVNKISSNEQIDIMDEMPPEILNDLANETEDYGAEEDVMQRPVSVVMARPNYLQQCFSVYLVIQPIRNTQHTSDWLIWCWVNNIGH